MCRRTILICWSRHFRTRCQRPGVRRRLYWSLGWELFPFGSRLLHRNQLLVEDFQCGVVCVRLSMLQGHDAMLSGELGVQAGGCWKPRGPGLFSSPFPGRECSWVSSWLHNQGSQDRFGFQFRRVWLLVCPSLCLCLDTEDCLKNGIVVFEHV